MTLLQFMLLAVTLLSLRLSGWRPPSWLTIVTLLWGILFYNGARAIVLGQFSVLVALALLLALWAIHRQHDIWAGMLLAVTTIKPQMVFLVVAFLLLYAVARRRWRLPLSFGLSVLALTGSAMLLVPSWPLDFVRNALAYSDYVAFGTPLENLLHYLLPASVAAPLTLWLSILLFALLLPGWWQAMRGDAPGGYLWAVLTTLIVGSLITFRSATTNQIILYLPLFFFFPTLTHRVPRYANTLSLLTALGLLLLMWATFILTLDGNWEHVMMHGLLPALLLLLYLGDYRALRRAAATEPGL
jgi:hypothetical protein